MNKKEVLRVNIGAVLGGLGSLQNTLANMEAKVKDLQYHLGCMEQSLFVALAAAEEDDNE